MSTTNIYRKSSILFSISISPGRFKLSYMQPQLPVEESLERVEYV